MINFQKPQISIFIILRQKNRYFYFNVLNVSTIRKGYLKIEFCKNVCIKTMIKAIQLNKHFISRRTPCVSCMYVLT